MSDGLGVPIPTRQTDPMRLADSGRRISSNAEKISKEHE